MGIVLVEALAAPLSVGPPVTMSMFSLAGPGQSGITWDLIGLSLRKSPFNDEVLSFDVTQFTHSLAKCLLGLAGTTCGLISYPRDFLWLRLGRRAGSKERGTKSKENDFLIHCLPACFSEI